MGPPSYTRSVVEQNVLMWHMTYRSIHVRSLNPKMALEILNSTYCPRYKSCKFAVA